MRRRSARFMRPPDEHTPLTVSAFTPRRTARLQRYSHTGRIVEDTGTRQHFSGSFFFLSNVIAGPGMLALPLAFQARAARACARSPSRQAAAKHPRAASCPVP